MPGESERICTDKQNGWLVNGEFLTTDQQLQRSKMYDELYLYYYHRYDRNNCCGKNRDSTNNFANKVALAQGATFARLQEIYQDEFGKQFGG